MILSGERQAMKAVLGLVSQGMETLAADRKNEVDGVAKERALAACLCLLRWCMRLDQDVISLLKQSGQNSEHSFLVHLRASAPLLHVLIK